MSFYRQSEPRESERSETDLDAIIHEELPGLDFAGKKVLSCAAPAAVIICDLCELKGWEHDVREIVVYWYSFSNPRTVCIHYGFSLVGNNLNNTLRTP